MKRYSIFLATLFCICSLSAQKAVFYFGENKEKIQYETIDTLFYVLLPIYCFFARSITLKK